MVQINFDAFYGKCRCSGLLSVTKLKYLHSENHQSLKPDKRRQIEAVQKQNEINCLLFLVFAKKSSCPTSGTNMARIAIHPQLPVKISGVSRSHVEIKLKLNGVCVERASQLSQVPPGSQNQWGKLMLC